jgi:hypothetical protein
VWSGRAGWVNALVFFVVLFPALDVASAFPLNGITLGNCLMGAYYGSEVHDVGRDRKRVGAVRVLAAVPPIVGACFVRELGTITDYTGITGFVIAFVFPALLQSKSKRYCKTKGLATRTHYSGAFSGGGVVSAVMVAFGGFLVAFVLGSLIWEGAK